MTDALVHAGSCLCGAITYTVCGALSDFGFCHCRSCQKASGAAHGANIGVRREHLDLVDRGGALTEYESSPGKVRTFCGVCGSPMFAFLKDNPELIRIRLGTLDSPLGDAPKAHTFVSEKASWHHIADNLPQFDAWADPTVLEQLGSRQPDP